MNNIINCFNKFPDYDPNLSWDNIIKGWEENFLGSNKQNEDFSYPLESDKSFDNYLDSDQSKKHISILPSLFDLNLVPEMNKFFTCINKDGMETFTKHGNNTIENTNVWDILRHSDYVSKPFFRFRLRKNQNKQDISNLLYLLSDCSFKLEIGVIVVLEIPKLLQEIKIFDVKKFIESNTMNEIKDMMIKYTNESCIINQKYYVCNKDDIYLDIPLLTDFFSYNISNTLIAMQYHNIIYKLIIPPHKINLIKKYLDCDENNLGITLMFEELIYMDNNLRKK